MYEDFVLLLKKSKFKKALDVLDAYLADSPEDVYLLTQKANILWNMNKYDDAYSCIQQADALSSGDGLLEYTAGRLLWSMGMYKESIERWNRIIRADDIQMDLYGYGKRWFDAVQNDARYYKADCLFKLYKDKEALQLVKEHLKNRKKGLQSDFTIGEVRSFMRMLSYSDSTIQRDLNACRVLKQQQAERIIKHINRLKDGKEWGALEIYLKRKSQEFPMDYWLKMELVEHYCHLKDKRCLDYAEEIYQQAPNDMLVSYYYAYSLYLNGKLCESLNVLRSIKEKGIDYMAYNEHGEGMRWAKKLMKCIDSLMNQIMTSGYGDHED